jgi:hypothetical protein
VLVAESIVAARQQQLLGNVENAFAGIGFGIGGRFHQETLLTG